MSSRSSEERKTAAKSVLKHGKVILFSRQLARAYSLNSGNNMNSTQFGKQLDDCGYCATSALGTRKCLRKWALLLPGAEWCVDTCIDIFPSPLFLCGLSSCQAFSRIPSPKARISCLEQSCTIVGSRGQQAINGMHILSARDKRWTQEYATSFKASKVKLNLKL